MPVTTVPASACGECTINPQPRPTVIGWLGGVREQRVELLAELVEPLPTHRIAHDHRGSTPGGRGESFTDLELHQLEGVGVDRRTEAARGCGGAPRSAASSRRRRPRPAARKPHRPDTRERFFRKRTWPGTSTKAMTGDERGEAEPEVDGEPCAAFSSAKRSGSAPVQRGAGRATTSRGRRAWWRSFASAAAW